MKFRKNLEDEVTHLATQAIVDRFQPILDRIFEEYSGKPVETIKPALAQRWADGNQGATITDPELTQFAQMISEGRRITLN